MDAETGTALCQCGSHMRVQRERRHRDVVEVLYGCEYCKRARIMKRSEGFSLINDGESAIN